MADEELQSVQVSNGTIMDPNNMVHAEMFKSLLYQVCASNTKNTKEREKVFHLICQKFSKNKVMFWLLLLSIVIVKAIVHFRYRKRKKSSQIYK